MMMRTPTATAAKRPLVFAAALSHCGGDGPDTSSGDQNRSGWNGFGST